MYVCKHASRNVDFIYHFIFSFKSEVRLFIYAQLVKFVELFVITLCLYINAKHTHRLRRLIMLLVVSYIWDRIYRPIFPVDEAQNCL